MSYAFRLCGHAGINTSFCWTSLQPGRSSPAPCCKTGSATNLIQICTAHVLSLCGNSFAGWPNTSNCNTQPSLVDFFACPRRVTKPQSDLETPRPTANETLPKREAPANEPQRPSANKLLGVRRKIGQPHNQSVISLRTSIACRGNELLATDGCRGNRRPGKSMEVAAGQYIYVKKWENNNP